MRRSCGKACRWSQVATGAGGGAGERLAARAAALSGEPPPAALALADGGASSEWRPERPWPTLLQQVRAADAFVPALQDWLAGIYLADSLEQAQALREQLPAGACLLTPEGHRVYAASLCLHAEAGGDGLMARKALLEAAQARLDSLLPEVGALQQRRESSQSRSGMLAEAVRAQRAR